MPFALTLCRPFVADHFHDLPGFQEDRHGHNWEVEATVELAREADEAPFAAALDAWVASVDYTLLNHLEPLQGRNPTAEALAEVAFLYLQGAAFQPQAIKIREKANYWALCRAEPGS